MFYWRILFLLLCGPHCLGLLFSATILQLVFLLHVRLSFALRTYLLTYLLTYLAARNMSKRKLPTSYSSIRRHIKAQVAADMKFIASDGRHGKCAYDDDDNESQNGCEQGCDIAHKNTDAAHCSENVLLFTNDGDSVEYDSEGGERNDGSSQSHSLTQCETDFDDCH